MSLTGPVPRPAADHVTWNAGILGTDLIDTEARPDMKRMRAYRLRRVREQFAGPRSGRHRALRPHQHPLRDRQPQHVGLDPPQRCAPTASSRPRGRWCSSSTATPFTLADGIETIDELRPALSWFYFGGGAECANRARKWGAEARGAGPQPRRREHAARRRPLRLHGRGCAARPRGGDGRGPEADGGRARESSPPTRSSAWRAAIAACEAGMARMHDALRGGMTENELWAILHATNIEMGGEWIETRLLSSGPRTNPWWRESCDRVIRPGELVSYDTDLIGPFGYCADISRRRLLRAGAAHRRAVPPLPHGLGPDSPQRGPGQARTRLQGVRRAGVAHPREVRPAALLLARSRRGHGRRASGPRVRGCVRDQGLTKAPSSPA